MCSLEQNCTFAEIVLRIIFNEFIKKNSIQPV